MPSKPRVSVTRCDAASSDAEVAAAVERTLAPLEASLRTFAGLRKVFVKTNIGLKEIKHLSGRQVALPEVCVVAAVVRALRAHTDAEIVVGDTTTEQGTTEELWTAMGYREALAGIDGVSLLDINEPPYVDIDVPGGGLMFSRYTLSQALMEADAYVSVQKMKAHMSTGLTLSLKNLFGITPLAVYGAPRRYHHAHVRLPHVIADLGLIFKPSLCVIDGLVSMNHKEWYGPGLKTDVLLAGDNTVATDAVGAHLMGFDPAGDYPAAPYVFDRNPLVLAANAGLGPLSLDEIDVVGAPIEKVGDFEVRANISQADNAEVHRTLAEQVALYGDDRDNYVDRYAGQYIGLSAGQVVYEGADLDNLKSRRQIAAEVGGANQGLFLKYVEPAASDPEHLAVYAGYDV